MKKGLIRILILMVVMLVSASDQPVWVKSTL